MKIVTCYKTVPDEQDISVAADKTLLFGREWKISEYDLNAIEAGVRLAEESGSELLALSVGGEAVDNSKLKKAVLSRGPSELFAVSDTAIVGADILATAELLAAAIKKIGGVGLVLCGEGSGDSYTQQVGNYLGSLLDYSTVNAVSSIALEGEKLNVERSLEDFVEILEIPLPAVLSVTSDINKPHIPGLKDIMAAGKKPVTIWGLADIGLTVVPVTQIVSTLAPSSMDRLQILIENSGEDQVAEFAKYIHKSLMGGGI
jgi:electron transfer flavoprotein beta subunit